MVVLFTCRRRASNSNGNNNIKQSRSFWYRSSNSNHGGGGCCVTASSLSFWSRHPALVFLISFVALGTVRFRDRTQEAANALLRARRNNYQLRHSTNAVAAAAVVADGDHSSFMSSTSLMVVAAAASPRDPDTTRLEQQQQKQQQKQQRRRDQQQQQEPKQIFHHPVPEGQLRTVGMTSLRHNSQPSGTGTSTTATTTTTTTATTQAGTTSSIVSTPQQDDDWIYQQEQEDSPEILRYTVLHASTRLPVTVREWFQGLAGGGGTTVVDASSASAVAVVSSWQSKVDQFTQLIATAPFDALYWETPGVTAITATTRRMELVLIDAPDLDKFATGHADSRTFSSFFQKSFEQSIANSLHGSGTGTGSAAGSPLQEQAATPRQVQNDVPGGGRGGSAATSSSSSTGWDGTNSQPPAVAFTSLGGDAVLVAPLPPILYGASAAPPAVVGGRRSPIDPAPYAHLAVFCRIAPPAHVQAYWRFVAITWLQQIEQNGARTTAGTTATTSNNNELQQQQQQQPTWCSTEGTGVAWLHVRFDQRPKYYKYTRFRNV